MTAVNRLAFSVLLITVGVLAGLGSLLARESYSVSSSTNYMIQNDVFSGGALDTASSANFKIQETIAEAMASSTATTTSANFGQKSGFWEAYPDQFITFEASTTAVELGELNVDQTNSASHRLLVDTNASNGFSITVSGSTLTDDTRTIDAIGATAAASVAGTEQFGLNVVTNTSPSVGLDPFGQSPIGSAANQYNIPNSFAFSSGDAIATSSSPINSTTFTVSYIANMSANTSPGTYTTSLTYSATASF